MIETRSRVVNHFWQIGSKVLEKAFFSLRAATQIEHGHPAGSQNERCELFRLAQAARAESLNRRDENLLHKILCCLLIPQMTEAIEPNTRSHPAEELRFGFVVGSVTDQGHQISILQIRVHEHTVNQHTLYV